MSGCATVAGLRVDYTPRDPADRLEYRPGDQARCDLGFPPVKIPLGPGQCGTRPVLVTVSSYSRFITAVMLPSRTTGDLLAGSWELMSSQMGAVPHRLIWDNEAGIGRRKRYAQGVAGFCGTLATRIVQLRPFDHESEGIVERQRLPGNIAPARADLHHTDGLQYPTRAVAPGREPAHRAPSGCPSGRARRDRPGCDAGPAADAASKRFQCPGPAPAGLLRPGPWTSMLVWSMSTMTRSLGSSEVAISGA